MNPVLLSPKSSFVLRFFSFELTSLTLNDSISDSSIGCMSCGGRGAEEERGGEGLVEDEVRDDAEAT